MDICSFEDLNRFPKQRTKSREIPFIKEDRQCLSNYDKGYDKSNHSSREEVHSTKNHKAFKQEIIQNKLTVNQVSSQRRSIDEGKYRDPSKKKYSDTTNSYPAERVRMRSISTVIPYANQGSIPNYQKKHHKESPNRQSPNELVNFHERISLDTVTPHQTNRRNTEILMSYNFNSDSSLMNLRSKNKNSKSSEEFNDTSTSWCSNESDFLSPNRYEASSSNESRKISTLSVPESNLLKSKSFSSFKEQYESSSSQEIINVETLVVPSCLGGRLTRHKSCDSSPCQNYILNIPTTPEHKRLKKKVSTNDLSL